MKIKHLLLKHKQKIVKKWFDLILETYPADTAKFLTVNKNRFANPVGHTISGGIEGLFDEIAQGMDPDRVSALLDNIIRIRALQKFSPSQALGFTFALKKVVREVLAKEIREHKLYEELLIVESEIDDLTKISFDIFMKCREKLYELKANEVRDLTSRLLRRVDKLDKSGAKEETAENSSLFTSLY